MKVLLRRNLPMCRQPKSRARRRWGKVRPDLEPAHHNPVDELNAAMPNGVLPMAIHQCLAKFHKLPLYYT